MKLRFIPAMILMLGCAHAQIRREQLTEVKETDVALPALVKWQQGVEAGYRKDGLIVPTFSSWWGLPYPSLKTLFPGHRFYAIAWTEQAAPGKEGEVLGLAALDERIACDAAGKIIKEFPHTGNYEAFGELLNEAKVAIRNAEDAKLVWNAFCDLHMMHWQKQPAVKIDERTWHLGDNILDGVHYYYEVRLGPDGVVEKAELQADDIKKPE